MIYITGMKHSGKTTVGQHIASVLSLPFKDIDDIILRIVDEEAHTGVFDSCRSVYKAFGGEYFRSIEARAAAKTAKGAYGKDLVCALGGGTIENTAAYEHLSGTGLFIYIRESSDILYERVSKNGIPAYLDKRNPHDDFIRLCQTREPMYEKAADITITGHGRKAIEIADEAIKRIREANHVV